MRLHEQSLALARGFGTTFGVAWSLRALGDAVRGQGDLRRARKLLEESLALSRGKEHAWGIARTLASLGNVEYEAGEYARASRLYEESLELGGRRMGLNHSVLVCLEGLARVAVAQGGMDGQRGSVGKPLRYGKVGAGPSHRPSVPSTSVSWLGPRCTRGSGIFGGVGKGPCSALGGGHQGYLIGQGCNLKSRRADSNR